MNSKQGLVQCCLGIMVFYCSSLVADVDSHMVLHFEDGFVSANISAEPLAEVARELEVKTGTAIHFQTSEAMEQAINVQFENLTLEAALRTILENTNYAMVTGSSEQGHGIQVYVHGLSISSLPGNASSESNVAVPEIIPERSQASALDPTQLPAPPDVFNSDPTIRSQDLEGQVALYGPESLGLVLAGAEDSDALVRSTAEQLLLNNLRDVVPRGTLSTIALRSERAENRLQALEALAERKDELRHVRMTLDGALRDADPQVRQRAEDLLRELPEAEPASMP
ncbi:MAG: HEAT repeat domain-containing protein [Gammaproteobacteria bacterium]